MDAGREKIAPAAALDMARAASRLLVARGRKIVSVRMQDDPADADVRKLIVGPSGNLRAPTCRRGRTLVVGFHPDMYAEAFGA